MKNIFFLVILIAFTFLNVAVSFYTVSFFEFLYKSYGKEVVKIHKEVDRLQINSDMNNHYDSGAADAETIYLLTRILKPKHILLVGSNSLIAFWVLAALEHSRRLEKVIGKVLFLKSHFQQLSYIQNYTDILSDPKVATSSYINIGKSLMTCTYTSDRLGWPHSINLNASFDLILLGSNNLAKPMRGISAFLSSLTHRRDISLPAMHIMFYAVAGAINNKRGKNSGNPLPYDFLKPNSTSFIGDMSYFLQRNSSFKSPILDWLRQNRNRVGFNLNAPLPSMLGGHRNMIVARRKFIENDAFLSTRQTTSASAAQGYGNGEPPLLMVASITKEPRVTLISPCSRVTRLSTVYRSIDFNMVSEWIIVYSHTLNLTNYNLKGTFASGSLHKITELFEPNMTGNFGNPERNLALDYISADRRGWIYFLDDDNVIHRNMWGVMQRTPLSRIVLVGQVRRDKGAVVGQECRLYWVDTSMFLMSRDMIDYRSYSGGTPMDANKSFASITKVRWDLSRHEADGLFAADVCSRHPADSQILLRYPASYHNGQLLPDNMIE